MRYKKTLILKDIKKDYVVGGETVQALRGVDIAFRHHELVAILGPSGCGKTTLLNIIGGLDHYTEGDLIINQRSTKDYNDQDWDRYRNKSIGFVFQNYNLISHQSVLSNVELALTLSGVSKKERKERATAALTAVGLFDQLKKKPNQMSGGQMQRVAIARALVNEPDIILADEPTGALDSTTSEQIMEILKQVSEKKLVIMVTHNAELAEQYASRIIRLKDGLVIDDTNPYSEENLELLQKKSKKQKKSFMNFWTALGLSLNNLMTKKGRTILTAFAGSIGIIGIALILSLSNGIQTYIDRVQEDTLSSYPITIESETMDMSSMMETLMGKHSEENRIEKEENRIYSNTILYDMMNAYTTAGTTKNDLKSLRDYIEDPETGFYDYASNVRYKYGDDISVYTLDPDNKIIKTDAMSIMSSGMSSFYTSDALSFGSDYFSSYSQLTTWEELLPGEDGQLISDIVKTQYDLVYGQWPSQINEVLLVINSRNELSDMMLYAMGLKSQSEMNDALSGFMSSQTVEKEVESWSFDDIMAKSFKLILDGERYEYDSKTNTYTNLSVTDAGLDYLYNSSDVGLELKVVGILKPNENASSNMISGSLCYTKALTDYIIETTQNIDVIKAQINNPDTDVILNLPFKTDDYEEPSASQKMNDIKEYISKLDVNKKATIYTEAMSQPSQAYLDSMVDSYMQNLTRESIENMMVDQYSSEIGSDSQSVKDYISKMDDETLFDYVEEMIIQKVKESYALNVKNSLSAYTISTLATLLDNGVNIGEEQYIWIYDNYMPATVSDSTYSANLKSFGYLNEDEPNEVIIYVSSFADKDEIIALIDAFNEGKDKEDQISYVDYVGLLMSSITSIINAISYVLIAFVAISLVVSSIMIAIITYISVLERTKEIGILRAIGASKKDVSRVFNAETIIEGLFAGLMGVGITMLLNIPINIIIHNLTNIKSLNSALPPMAGVILVIISIILTFIAGLVPSGMAAKKDPVIALRTE